MKNIDNFINSNQYFNIFDNQLETLDSFTDLMKYFVGKRLLPIICNELNDYQIGDYRTIPTPELNGQEDVYCLANDETLLTNQTAFRYDPVNNIWNCIVLCKAIGYTEKQQPEYRVISKAILKYNNETGNVFFSYQSSDQPQFQPDINYFQEKTGTLLINIVNNFIKSPLMSMIQQYDSITEFRQQFVHEINETFKHQNLGEFKVYLDNNNQDVNIRLKKYDRTEVDDLANIFSYNAALNQSGHGENSFYNGELVNRNEWENPVGRGQVHCSDLEELTASRLFNQIISSKFPETKFIHQKLETN